MFFTKEPELEEIVRKNYFAVGHILNYVIIQNELGEKYFAEDPEGVYERNEVFMGKTLLTIDELPLQDQEKIKKEMNF